MGNAAETMDAIAGAAHLLADRTRLRILLLLSEGEMNVSQVVKRLGCGQPMASHHLNILRTNDMVRSRREGKRIHYRLTHAAPAAGTIRVTARRATIAVGRDGGR